MSNKKELEIDEHTIDYLSKLSLLELEESEKESIKAQLNDIITHFKKLDDLETENVKPTRHPIEELQNVFRKDQEWESLTQEEALKNAKKTKNKYFKAPRVVRE